MYFVGGGGGSAILRLAKNDEMGFTAIEVCFENGLDEHQVYIPVCMQLSTEALHATRPPLKACLASGSRRR